MNKLKKKMGSTSTGGRTPSPVGGGNKLALGRLQKDLAAYEPVEGATLKQINPKDFYKYTLILTPLEGLYQGGKWEFSVDFPEDYPNEPPKVHCKTQIYHPNIDLDGNVCLSILRVNEDEGWSPLRSYTDIVYGMLSLFYEPNPNHPLNIEAGELMKTNIEEFKRTVHRTMRGGRFFGKNFSRMFN